MTPTIHRNPQTGAVTLTHGRLELIIATRPAFDPHGLRDLSSGRAFADSPYVWPGGERPTLNAEPALTSLPDGTHTAAFHLSLGALTLTHTFTLPGDEPGVLLEGVTLHNPGPQPLDTSAFSCGFAKVVRDARGWLADVAESRLCEIPYRHHPATGERRDFALPALLQSESWFSSMRDFVHGRHTSPAYGSEAWAWYSAGAALLVSKYNADALEWSVLEQVQPPAAEAGEAVLRFGGAARWKLGDPEGAAGLAPGASFTFGVTRYSLLAGGWQAAFADYRRYTERQGHTVPAGYNPPVHWNELYDNPYFWTVVHESWHVDRPENRARLYTLPDMQIEIDKAVEIGCECFYMDPGWDTDFGSTIWDEARLGQQADFAARLREQYGLALALHTPLAPWSNNASYPPEARQLDADGQRRADLCVISPAYMDLKVVRLRELCRNGAYFLMYDGSWYEHPCFDPAHGHAVPSTRQEHVDAILRLAQRLHAAYPQAVIEQHDPITGPGTTRYTPTYFMHGKAAAFDELWGFEFMLNALDDLASERAFALYDFNLAYSLPVYLHFDLRTDNVQAIGFWWFASTCRHLGFGGRHADARVWEAHKQAMQQYLAHKRFFTQGVFYGLDELTHGHSLPAAGACLLNCFNPTDAPVTRPVTFGLAEFGLPEAVMTIVGAVGQVDGGVVTLTVTVPAQGHQLVVIQP